MRKFVPPGRRTIIVASVSAALAGAALALAGGGTAVQGAGHGLARAGSSGTAVSSLASGPATSTFGPTVIDGIYQGESPPVSQLPILPVTPGPLHTRDNESLQSGSTDAQDPVVQHHKGSGPLSAPIQNFDGICLPFGPPCAQPSSCSCLPPDTNGEVGATQYVQIVNSDFAVYSKAGASSEARRRSTSFGPVRTANVRPTTKAIQWSSTTSWRSGG